MNLLLDTHVLLWWLDDHPSLSERVKKIIADGNNLAFVSAAVIWEIRIKQALGKLAVPSEFRLVLDQQPFEAPISITVLILNPRASHLSRAARMVISAFKFFFLTIL